MSNLYINTGLKWNDLLQPAFAVCSTYTTELDSWFTFGSSRLKKIVIPVKTWTQIPEDKLPFALYFMLLYVCNYEWKEVILEH